MTKRHKCPRCFFKKAYKIRRGKIRCIRCKYEWTPNRLPLKLKASQWRNILGWFLRGVSSQNISVEARTLLPIIYRRIKQGSTICSDTWKSYTGIAAKGYVHRLVEHSKNEYVDKQGNHINGLEGFWGYLKRQLAAKGGVRKERLHLYLAVKPAIAGYACPV